MNTKRNQELPKYLSATPAYGRDYFSARATREAWDEGKDFQMHTHDGRENYFSRRDEKLLVAAGVCAINIRYRENRRVLVIELENAK